MIRKPINALLSVTKRVLFAAALAGSQATLAAEPFLGQIEYLAFDFSPRGWVPCDGGLLPIEQNQALFSLLGSTFGGDGRVDFALPDMRGRVPVHDGGSAGTNLTRRVLGTRDGEEQHVLTVNEIPAHTHTLRANSSVGNQVLPGTHALAADLVPEETYRNEAPDTDMHVGSIGATSSGGHENMPPFLVINCVIALEGTFPPRN